MRAIYMTDHALCILFSHCHVRCCIALPLDWKLFEGFSDCRGISLSQPFLARSEARSRIRLPSRLQSTSIRAWVVFKVDHTVSCESREIAKVRTRLTRISRENFHDVIELELEEEQEKHLPSNVYSIAESTLSPSFHPRAICVDEEVVGFAMYQFGEVGDFDEDECTVWRFMIDRRHQNTGIGTIAMGLLLKEIKAHNRCKLVDIYYDPLNTAARKLYAHHGFREVGERDDGDVIAERPA